MTINNFNIKNFDVKEDNDFFVKYVKIGKYDCEYQNRGVQFFLINIAGEV